MSSPHLPQSGMMLSGVLYQQERWVHHTGETGGLQLPTPVASDHKRLIIAPSDLKSMERGFGYSLPSAVALTVMTEMEILKLRAIGQRIQVRIEFVEWMMGYPKGWTEID